MSTKHHYQIDNKYAIGTFLVLAGHSHPSDWGLFSGTLFEDIITFIYEFHMPLFSFQTQWFGLSDLKDALLYFSIGMVSSDLKLLNRIKGMRRISVVSFTAITVISIILYHFCDLNRVMLTLITIMMILNCLLLAESIGDSKCCHWVSTHCFIIIFTAGFFQATVMYLCGRIGIGWKLLSVLMLLGGMIGPAIIITVYEKTCLKIKVMDLMLGIRI